MKKRYKISLAEVQKFVRSLNRLGTQRSVPYKTNAKQIKEHLERIFDTYQADAVLDGDALKNLFFPTQLKDRYRIFISHSSKDAEIIQQFASTLETRLNFPCFVDWMVWGNLYELQASLDQKLCNPTPKATGGVTYSYNLRNYTTAHTHAMLSMALLDMIDQCDICMFVYSDNSTVPNADFNNIETLSPWIYEEISYMNRIQIKETRLMSEGGNVSPIRISHPLDLDSFDTLNASTLTQVLTSLNE